MNRLRHHESDDFVRISTKRGYRGGFSMVGSMLAILIAALLVGISLAVYEASKREAPDPANSDTRPYTSTTTQTYTNDKIGFSLQYPNDWVFSTKDSKGKDGLSAFGSDQFTSKTNYEANDNSSPLFIEAKMTTARSVEDYAEANKSGREHGMVSRKSSKINGYDAYTINFKTPAGNPLGYQVFVARDGKVVHFTYYDTSGDVSVFRAIIDSIQFK